MLISHGERIARFFLLTCGPVPSKPARDTAEKAVVRRVSTGPCTLRSQKRFHWRISRYGFVK